MDNLILTGRITATSKKQNDIYKNKTKTSYITLKDEEEYKKAEDFGFTVYESKDGNKFLIVKLVKKFKAYLDGEEIDLGHLSGLDTANFNTEEVFLNFIKARHSKTGNIFYRLQSIQLNDKEDITIFSGKNPFKE